MSLIKRVLLYLLRKRGRSILLMVIIFIMSTFLLVGISVKSSADQAAEELRKSIGSSFILEAVSYTHLDVYKRQHQHGADTSAPLPSENSR